MGGLASGSAKWQTIVPQFWQTWCDSPSHFRSFLEPWKAFKRPSLHLSQSSLPNTETKVHSLTMFSKDPLRYRLNHVDPVTNIVYGQFFVLWDNPMCKILTKFELCPLQEKQGELPSFLLSWLLYLSSLAQTELPNYNLLLRILKNSQSSWTDFHPASSPGSSILSIPEESVVHKKLRSDSAIYAAEE